MGSRSQGVRTILRAFRPIFRPMKSMRNRCLSRPSRISIRILTIYIRHDVFPRKDVLIRGCVNTAPRLWGVTRDFKAYAQNVETCILSKLQHLHQIQPNFAQWQKLANTLCGWSKHADNKSKMAVAAILKKIAISQQRVDWSIWNLAQWLTLTLRTVSAVEYYTPWKICRCDAAFCQDSLLLSLHLLHLLRKPSANGLCC